MANCKPHAKCAFLQSFQTLISYTTKLIHSFMIRPLPQALLVAQLLAFKEPRALRSCVLVASLSCTRTKATMSTTAVSSSAETEGKDSVRSAVMVWKP